MGFLVIVTCLLIFSFSTWANTDYECGSSFSHNLTPWLVKVEVTGKNGDFLRCLGVVISPTNVLTSSDCLKSTKSADLKSYTLDIYIFKDSKGHSNRGLLKFLDNVYTYNALKGVSKNNYAILTLEHSLPKIVPPICMSECDYDDLDNLLEVEWTRKAGFFTTASELSVNGPIKFDDLSSQDLIKTLLLKKITSPGIVAVSCNGRWHLLKQRLTLGP